MFVPIKSVVVVILCVAHVVNACMCPSPGPANEVLCRSDRFVIKGTVANIRRYPGDSRILNYRTKVEEVFSLPAKFQGRSTISILAFIPDGISCSMSFEKGKTYLITGLYFSNHFVTSYCHRSVEWQEVPLNEIEALTNHPPCTAPNLDESETK